MKLTRGYYDVFVRTCAKYPSYIALRQYQENETYKTYTYSELYGVCEYISQNLQQLQFNKGILGLVSERNIIIPSVIAAAHKCGTTFMFVDPSQNLEKISNNVIFTIILTIKKKEDDNSSELFGKKPDKTVDVFDFAINFYNFKPFNTQDIKHENQHSFIAMTSGSTGEPKHIQIPITCIQPNLDDLTTMFQIKTEDIIYFSTPLTFDPSMIEIILACMNGASLLIAPEKINILFPENKDNSITFWQTTPSKFFQHSNADIRNKILSANSTLKILALGGEPLNGVKRLKDLKDFDNKTRIFTLYGVTEMSCWATVAELDLEGTLTDKEIPLGNCLSETEIVIEPEQENQSIGKIILVSKTRKCYILNKPNTAEENSIKFVDTGDLGELRNGTIYYRGRKDNIIKRFGHKVNLEQIECAVMQCPQVKTCSCIWLPKPKLLVVYFSSELLSSRELSNHLKCKLDDKHWPDKVIRVDNLPTNPHGKISKQLISQMFKKQLVTPQTMESLKSNFLLELNETLHKNISFAEVKNKDFFSLGGTSFLAVTMCNKLSNVSPQFAKTILPYLISPKYTIGNILKIGQKETSTEEITQKKRKKKIKVKSSVRSIKTNSLDVNDSIQLNCLDMDIDNPDVPVEFTMMWSFDTDKCVDASPVLFQTSLNLYVIVGSHSGKIVIMDAITGILKGLIKIDTRIEATVLCHQFPTPRAVVGGYDGTVVCFEIEEQCSELWRMNVGSMIKSKAVCLNGIIYLAAYDGNVRALDIVTGLIKSVINICDQSISADLITAKNQFVLVGSLSGVCASIYTPTNTIVWRSKLSSPVFARPALYNEDKYVIFAEVNGEIHCMTVEKGDKIWKYQGTSGNIFSSMYIREINVTHWQMIFGCHDHKVYNVNIKDFQPSLNWRTELTSPVFSTPCRLTDKLTVAISINGKLCVLDSENGIFIADYSFPGEVFSSPTIYNNYIFVGCRNDHLYSIKYNLIV